MLVNFSKPHAVDVPVRDLDDPDDDVLFADHRRSENPRGFFDYLDYDGAEARDGNVGGGFFSRLHNYFTLGRRLASYELMGGRDDIDYFNVDDDDDVGGDEPQGHNEGQGLRKYQIKRLERKLNRTILCFVCGLVFVFAFLFFKTDKLGVYGSLPVSKIVLSNSTHHFHPTTIMISLDGFHPHYISSENTPALHKMLVEEYGAPYMTPSFPSSTFPNHWTLVTGLYPADHGIVGNTFFDPVLQKQFINTNPAFGLDPEFWQGGEPIWTTAAKQGVKSAIHMWPGSEVPSVGDNGPLFVDKYNGTEPLVLKADRLFHWLDTDNLQERPELLLSYVPTIDQFGHKYGISGGDLLRALHDVDDFVQLIQDRLVQRNLQSIVNLVIVSDHGMAPTSNDRLLILDDVVDLDRIEHIDGWPLFGLRPKNGVSVDDVHLEIKQKLAAAKKGIRENFNLYKVEDFPREYNFGGNITHHRFNYRLAPLWIVPNVGYSVTTRAKFEENNKQYFPKGAHGYNNTHLLMRAIFLGQGPYFEKRLSKSKKVLPFTNVNVYNIVCDTLQLEPSPNNGSLIAGGFAISSANYLPTDWSDSLVYPDLPYVVDHIVEGATYDELWQASGKQSRPNDEDLHKPSTGVSPKPSESSSMNQPEPLSPSVDTPPEDESSADKEGFFGHVLGGVGHLIDDIDSAVEGAVEDAMEMAESWFGGDS